MQYTNLILEQEGHIATVTLNRPDMGNSLNQETMQEIYRVFKALSEDDDIRAVILTGAGKHFCTGLDFTMFAGGGSPFNMDPVSTQEEDQPGSEGSIMDAVVVIRNMPKPVIAAVNGTTLGLGFSVALACDMRIASDRARFSMMFIKRALIPDTGASYTLPRVVGFPKACELLLTGDSVDAGEAERIGLVNKVVPHDDLISAARELAGRIVKNAPLAVAKTKTVLYESALETDIALHMKRELDYQSKLLQSEDFVEATKAYIEKREPVFKGK